MLSKFIQFDFISYAKVNEFILMKNLRTAIVDNCNGTYCLVKFCTDKLCILLLRLDAV